MNRYEILGALEALRATVNEQRAEIAYLKPRAEAYGVISNIANGMTRERALSQGYGEDAVWRADHAIRELKGDIHESEAREKATEAERLKAAMAAERASNKVRGVATAIMPKPGTQQFGRAKRKSSR